MRQARGPLRAALFFLANLSERSVEVKRDLEPGAEPLQRFGIELSASRGQRALRNREEVVAVHDAIARKTVRSTERNFRRQASDRSGHGDDCHVGEERNRTIAGDDDDGPPTAGEFDVVGRASVQSGSPPSLPLSSARP
jgi:hypothetical protein